jgi:hypothetical protein
MFHCLPYETEPYDIQNTININSGNNDASNSCINLNGWDVSNTLHCDVRRYIGEGLSSINCESNECEQEEPCEPAEPYESDE